MELLRVYQPAVVELGWSVTLLTVVVCLRLLSCGVDRRIVILLPLIWGSFSAMACVLDALSAVRDVAGIHFSSRRAAAADALGQLGVGAAASAIVGLVAGVGRTFVLNRPRATRAGSWIVGATGLTIGALGSVLWLITRETAMSERAMELAGQAVQLATAGIGAMAAAVMVRRAQPQTQPLTRGSILGMAAAAAGVALTCLLCAPRLQPPRAFASAFTATTATAQLPATSVAITNVTVIDVLSGAKETGVTVVTKGGDIAAIGRAVSVPPGAARVDGAGKFLIPGLWDMHSHNQASGAESLDLYLAHGVVGTRDMGSDLDFILPLRDRIRRGEASGPEIVASGPMLDNAPAGWPYRRRVTNAQEAREAVRDLKRRGVDFIKVHTHTPRDVFFAIADEAPKLGLPFAGHIPFAVTVAEGAASGMRSIEHFSESRVFRDCAGPGQPYDAAACRPLFEELARRGVWQTPTLAFFRALPEVFSGKPMPHAEYATDSLLELTRKNIEVSKLDERALSLIRSLSRTSLGVVRDMLPRGNAFLAGCDGSVPGFCLHDELQILTEAGLSPLQALQTATINPARLLGRDTTQGSLAAGKRADLVLLDADPTADILNARRIAAVVVRGRLLSKADIEGMIAKRRRPSR